MKKSLLGLDKMQSSIQSVSTIANNISKKLMNKKNYISKFFKITLLIYIFYSSLRPTIIQQKHKKGQQKTEM